MRRDRNGKCKNKAAIILFIAAIICLCLLSAKLTLIILALALAAAGIWLLRR